jgi:hypothetical protein
MLICFLLGEPARKSNRVRYDLFEQDFLRYLKDEVNWKAVAGEKETAALKQARHDLNLVRADLDQTRRLIARRTEQMSDPDLSDDVVKEFASQIVGARSRLATLQEQQNRLEGMIGLESTKAAALHTPERLIEMIRSGDFKN